MDDGLLFYLSGENGTTPDYAAGNSVPNFLRSVETIGDGVNGRALRMLPDQLLAFWASGNLYSQRGTVAFFFRPRTALGETEFPLFRVSFADHSSWDSLFLRIDYNGHGVDAFVTDINLSRLRVSHRFAALPSPDRWFHVCFGWDEAIGVSLFIDGKPAGEVRQTALLDAGLDQFGTHSRIISNAQVQSSYNYMRTGDFDEIRLYDRMLGEDCARALAACQPPPQKAPERRASADAAWMRRYGFDNGTPPAQLSHRATAVRKVEIHDAWDLKRWWWKGCDGIRETTWPGVYNRSRLPGRLDYFVLPDWDCYSQSGREITFVPLPDEPFNHIEISGSAEGTLRVHGRLEEAYLGRRLSSERSVLRLPEPVRNVSVTFTNDRIEEPIGDITLLHVEPGVAPTGVRRDAFRFSPDAGSSAKGVDAVRAHVRGRRMEGERTLLVGGEASGAPDMEGALPIVHLAMPYADDPTVGLDGVLLRLPALHAVPSHDGLILISVSVRDPLWIDRNLIQFTFAVRPGQPKDIWLDTRDRFLPEGAALYMILAFSAPVSGEDLAELSCDMVYKPYGAAKAEHVADRFIQVKDNYANLVEENPSNDHFNMFNRFRADLLDLLRVCPEHRLAREYWYDKFGTEKPAFSLSEVPDGVPAWAWRQTEYMRYIKRYLRWWIDKRQIENGEFGGGLSDDGDLTAWWPGPAIVGCMPEKIKESLLREMEAFYDQGMFCNGLCAIQTDQLHTLEEGIQCLGQCLTLAPTSPKQIERAIENARGLSFITARNGAGHLHVRSGYYSGTRVATEPAWAYSASDSFHVFHPAYMLVRYNGSPKARALILEVADAMLAHWDGVRLRVQIDFDTDESRAHERTREWPLFYAAYRFTGDEKYLAPIADADLYAGQQRRLTGSVAEKEAKLAAAYECLTEKAALREYINTDGQLWVDRGVLEISQMQLDRVGGIAHIRFALYPRHYLRWIFQNGQETDVAILVSHGAPDRILLSAYNMTDTEIAATLVAEDLLPGVFRVRTAVSDALEDLTGAVETTREINRFSGFVAAFAPGAYTVMELALLSPGVPYWDRADLAIDPEDVIIREDCVRVRVHNIGAKESAPTTLALVAPDGAVLRKSDIPPIPAPDDLYPKVLEIPLWTRGLALSGCAVVIDPEGRIDEITRENNRVTLP